LYFIFTLVTLYIYILFRPPSMCTHVCSEKTERNASRTWKVHETVGGGGSGMMWCYTWN